MATFIAFELITAAKAFQAAEAQIMSVRPEGYPRAAWRAQAALPPSAFAAKQGRARRTLGWVNNGSPYDLWVWSGGAKPKLVEQIDLRAADADARLARYTKV